MLETSLSIRPTMKELEHEDLLHGLSDAELEARYEKSPKQHALDLYARLVPVIGEVTAIATVIPPYPYASKSFRDLEGHAAYRLGEGINKYLLQHPDSDSDTLTRLARRHEANGSRRKLLSDGSTASVRFMNEAISRIPTLYKRAHGQYSQDPEELVQIAETNYMFVAMHAKQHIADSVALRDMGKYFSTTSFSVAFSHLQLSEDNKLFFPEDFREKLPASYNSGEAKLAKGGEREAIGCPALYAGAVHKLWQWHLIGAERVYQEQIQARRSPIVVFPGIDALSAD